MQSPRAPRFLSTPAARTATTTAASVGADSARADDPVRVLIVDDHPCVRDYLRGVLDSVPELASFVYVGEADTGRDALRLAQEQGADLVVLDLALPDGDGVAVVGQLRALCPAIRVLVFTGRVMDDAQAAALVRLGVTGYLSKNAALADLVTALRAVAVGCLYITGAARQAAAPMVAGNRLTAREQRVLTLLLDGHGTQAIAAQMHVTPRTVKFHLQNLYAKTGASSRTELMARAYRHSFLI